MSKQVRCELRTPKAKKLMRPCKPLKDLTAASPYQLLTPSSVFVDVFVHSIAEPEHGANDETVFWFEVKFCAQS